MAIYSEIRQKVVTNKVLVGDEEAVHQSVSNILNTQVGERLFNPEFGSTLDDLLFNLLDEAFEVQIYNELVTCIQRWDPRVVVRPNDIEVKAYPDQNKCDISMSFNIIGLGEQLLEYRGVLKQG